MSNIEKRLQPGEYLEEKCSEFADFYLDATYPNHPSIVDNDDLKVNGLMIPIDIRYCLLG